MLYPRAAFTARPLSLNFLLMRRSSARLLTGTFDTSDCSDITYPTGPPALKPASVTSYKYLLFQRFFCTLQPGQRLVPVVGAPETAGLTDGQVWGDHGT